MQTTIGEVHESGTTKRDHDAYGHAKAGAHTKEPQGAKSGESHGAGARSEAGDSSGGGALPLTDFDGPFETSRRPASVGQVVNVFSLSQWQGPKKGTVVSGPFTSADKIPAGTAQRVNVAMNDIRDPTAVQPPIELPLYEPLTDEQRHEIGDRAVWCEYQTKA